MRIGALGAARITPRALLEPAREVDGVSVVAVAARNLSVAEAFAAEHGIPGVRPDYASIVEDDSLDAVYVPLPPSLHVEWCIRALEAGRHVLVEKPFASNATEAAELVRASERTGRLLVEAFHWRYHPLAARMLELRGRLGALHSATAEFSNAIPDRTDLRYQPELGGGALMDLGCYPIHWLRVLSGEEPEVERATVVEDPPGIDLTMVADYRFPSGLEARMRTSMAPQEQFVAHLTIEGEEGTLDVTNPILPQNGHRIRASFADGEEIDESLEASTTYVYQLEAFRAMVEDGLAPITGGADAIANMAAIDATYLAAGLRPRNG
jgi:predicted dehydrogenase